MPEIQNDDGDLLGRPERTVMDSNGFSAFSTFSVRRQTERSLQKSSKPVVAEMKARQVAKIRELGRALIDAGFLTLDEQSKALGLARSTTWTILRASHKGSGLSAAIIKRMLLSPQLPPLSRRRTLEYTTDKVAGLYGGRWTQRRKFFERVGRATPEEAVLSRVNL